MTPPQTSPVAWEPLTPRGVAAFARATTARLLVVQLLVALLVAMVVAWFLFDAWCPIVREAIKHLPDEGQIRGGQLNWRGDSPRLLAESTFLAFSVDLDHSGEFRSPAHLQVEFSRRNLFVYSLLGHAVLDYPTGYTVAFNREELGPWWGAWQPSLLAIAALVVIVGLMSSWFLLAAIYALPVWLLVYFANRDLKLVECWRLAGAALLPGAVLMAAGILLYDFGAVDLVGLGFVTAGHLLLGWIYLFICPLFLARAPQAEAAEKNPFVPPDAK